MSEPTAQTVCLHVATSRDATFESLWAELDRLGEIVRVDLRDDGGSLGEVAWDGVYTGCHSGAWARYAGVRIIGTPLGEEARVLFVGLEQTPDASYAVLAWRVGRLPDGTFEASRASTTWPGNRLELAESLPLLAAFGWGLLLLAYVFFLARQRAADRS